MLCGLHQRELLTFNLKDLLLSFVASHWVLIEMNALNFGIDLSVLY